MHLDVFTMTAMLSVVSLTMAGSLLWLSRGSGRNGLLLCASALVLFALATPLMGLRSTPLLSVVSILGSNLMIAVTLVLLLWAVCRFHHVKPHPSWTAGPLCLLIPGLLLMLDNLSGRVIFASLLFAFQHSVLGWVTLKHRPRQRNGDGHTMAAAATYACAVVLVIRAALEALGINSIPAFPTSELRYNYFVVTMAIAVIVFTLGFIFMVREAVDEDFRQLSIRDDLTGIANRRHLLNQLNDRLEEAVRSASPFSLLVIDIDRFKSINDNLGHLAGDAVLVEVAHAISSRIRSGDLVGRYGGEEFIVLLPHTAPREAMIVAEDLRRCVETLTIPVANQNLRVTVSIGVCGSPPDAPLSQDALLAGADHAMYRAKDLGRNRVAGPAGKEVTA